MKKLLKKLKQHLELRKFLTSKKKIHISVDMDDMDLVRISFDGSYKNYLFIKGNIKTNLLVFEAKQRLSLIEKLETEPKISYSIRFRLITAAIMSVLCYKLGYIGLIPFIASLVYSIYEIWKKSQTIKTKGNCEDIVKYLSVNEVDENP